MMSQRRGPRVAYPTCLVAWRMSRGAEDLLSAFGSAVHSMPGCRHGNFLPAYEVQSHRVSTSTEVFPGLGADDQELLSPQRPTLPCWLQDVR